MNVLLVGGVSSLLNGMVNKLHKEGNRVHVLTGNRFKESGYSQKVFEKYSFPLESESLLEVFESVNPDVVVVMGAFDTNYNWDTPKKETMRFYAGLSNVLMTFSQMKKGRLIYLSSDEVYGEIYNQEIVEEEYTFAKGFHAVALAQAEEMCEGYRRNNELDIVTLRLDHLYCMPENEKDIYGWGLKTCLTALENGEVTVNSNRKFSMLYQADAVEAIYKVVNCTSHEKFIYHISDGKMISEMDVVQAVKQVLGEELEIIDEPDEEEKWQLLAHEAFDTEFRFSCRHSIGDIIPKIMVYMKRYRWKFQSGFRRKSLRERMGERMGTAFQAMIPFLENIICFIPFYFLHNYAETSAYFSNLDFYLFYVLIFAVVYGQLQATFSAVLAVVGYYYSQLYGRNHFEMILDYNTYAWIAQLFILGLVVGYMRDQLRVVRGEREQEIDFLAGQLEDIQDINVSNVRMKQVMETQIVNQNDSVGTIYEITAKLEQYVPEEVLFYAAEMIMKLVDSQDVAIYSVSGGGYARLVSSTSQDARKLGNSIKYMELEDMYQVLKEKRVFINKKMDETYPHMANAIYSEDAMQLIVMVWGIPWERMTLGQANRMVVISYLIQNAVVRANRHMEALEYKRYVAGTRILETEAFYTLVQAFQNARSRGLTECSILKLDVQPQEQEESAEKLRGKLRSTDYIGRLKDGNLYVLLSNSNDESAKYVISKFEEIGYQSHIQEEILE
ncbi:MAG: NAD(P)-dependent oxidoreductase [Lachnospiraceae bacterium]|nr:NAD(P)-dependent oxidoreductase [Lachnospiraceae bacterium]